MGSVVTVTGPHISADSLNSLCSGVRLMISATNTLTRNEVLIVLRVARCYSGNRLLCLRQRLLERRVRLLSLRYYSGGILLARKEDQCVSKSCIRFS